VVRKSNGSTGRQAGGRWELGWRYEAKEQKREVKKSKGSIGR
jgi:hypothetical protein